MTYNFDPDKWYDDELFIIETKCKQGKMDQKAYDRAVAELDRQLANMWHRLDGTYQVGQD